MATRAVIAGEVNRRARGFIIAIANMTEEEKQDWYRDTDWLHETFWRWQSYRRPSLQWNHEHCLFCSQLIAEPSYRSPNVLHEAWTTTFLHPEGDPGYEWVCPSCFEQLRGVFAWGFIKTRELAP